MFGERLKELRTNLDITQKAMANILYVSQNTVRNWEQNKYIPSLDLCLRMCQIFNCSLKYLLGDENVIVPGLDGREVIEMDKDYKKYIFTINNKPLSEEQIKAIVELIQLVR